MDNDQEAGFLRLFPLQGCVLYPGMEVPLVLFEPRYLQLARECIESGEPFGIVLLKSGREVGDSEADPHLIGTSAAITSSENTSDGRIHIIAEGQRRFRVVSFSYDRPYLSGQVEYLEEDSGMIDPSVVQHLREDAEMLIKAVLARQGGYVREVHFPEDPSALSYQVAQLFQGSSRIQQKLLEASTLERLWQEQDLIKNAMREATRPRPASNGPSDTFSVN